MALHSATVREYAQAWAAIAIEVIERPYPYSSGHLARGPEDVDITPQRLHPAFGDPWIGTPACTCSGACCIC
ncbi:hypothetical protein [Ornithinimicrobium sp. INDO-MA30-4]|uniref:hypothetical protein n=1 Tax=Ornithinimicrobium sp. INDO-MA30-4 TaxID=2908651 RepID=UPI001F42325E|nr:hypothetical protein [Ornithinimicrobium sp. INDO-MA30-4]UJH70305.1 hypothetical protein L0A91_14365 [Ornithinimicrobium sp. INDO-MA30-4]